jgi:tetratricopeptide (TPR) repeat protein
MNRGDWLAAPLSSPGVWNFLIKEGLDSSDLGWTIESLEFDSRLAGRGDIVEAESAYAAAGRLFEDAGARRGLAALRLREGYLAALEGDYASAVRHGSAALEHFEATGDLLGTQLARTHLLLGSVGLGRFPEDSETAAAIGSWGQQRGSFSYALGLGLLLSRAGRYWLVRKGDYERALACFRLAESLFRALAATGNAAQSLVDQAMTYYAIGEPYGAAEAYERARDLYSRIPANVPGLGAFRWQTSKLEREIYSIYEKHRNADGMARCLARLEQMAGQPVPQMGEDDWAADMFSGFSYLASTHSNTMVVETDRVMLYRVRALEAHDKNDFN